MDAPGALLIKTTVDTETLKYRIGVLREVRYETMLGHGTAPQIYVQGELPAHSIARVRSVINPTTAE
jgi:hypothetical protein